MITGWLLMWLSLVVFSYSSVGVLCWPEWAAPAETHPLPLGHSLFVLCPLWNEDRSVENLPKPHSDFRVQQSCPLSQEASLVSLQEARVPVALTSPLWSLCPRLLILSWRVCILRQTFETKLCFISLLSSVCGDSAPLVVEAQIFVESLWA